ncbi:MAG: hypothetical protein JWL95_1670 [Gemmatimonadetes bacterium]|nr:hypothetical protein [Gemmatimonadota bacterium]
MHRTSRSAVVAALVMVLLPTMAQAQGGVHHDNSPFAGKPAPIAPVSMAKVVLESDKDMALSDSQRVQLALIQKQLDSVNAPLLALLDSLKPSWRPAGGLNDLSQEQRDELVTRRNAQIALVQEITPNFVKARERVMAVLRPEQQDRANKLEKNARKRAEEVAKRELQQLENVGMQQRGRRGDIRDGTGRTPLG